MIKSLLTVSVIFLAGCATTASDLKRAAGYCQNNGGVTQIEARYNSAVNVTCGNTARFEFTSSE